MYKLLAIGFTLLLALTILFTGHALDSMIDKPVSVWDCTTDLECRIALARWEDR